MALEPGCPPTPGGLRPRSHRLALVSAVRRLQGFRWPPRYSPNLYRAGILRQQRERSRVPGMTKLTERAYFKWHAQEEVTGSGTIIDLGCWLGSTTAALAMGLSANRKPAASSTLIHAYDLFVWDPRTAYHVPPTRLGPYSDGDSFRREFELVVRRWRDRIVVHEGDLEREGWTDGPIELLLVDAMKSWNLTTHILRHFCPSLLPIDGYLIHQYSSHCFTPWIPLVSFRLLDHLRPVRDIPGSESFVFRLMRPVPSRDLNLTRSSFDEPEIDQAFQYWLSATPPAMHSGLRTARILLAHYDGDTKRARAMRRSLCERDLIGEFHQSTLQAVVGH